MLRKEEILERTSNGLAVFKHYLPGNWRIGRNFLNPLYEDSKASCNIYFDRRGGIYKMKDFGNDSYSGDCFFLVGQLKGLDCNRAADFVEILEIIDRIWAWGWLPALRFPFPGNRLPGSAGQTRRNARKADQFPGTKFPLPELVYWQQYGIHARTAETLQGHARSGVTQRGNGRGQRPWGGRGGGGGWGGGGGGGGGRPPRNNPPPPPVQPLQPTTSSVQNPRPTTRQTAHQAVPPVLNAPLLDTRQLRRELLFRAEQLPAKSHTQFITGARKTSLPLARTVFTLLLQQRETETIPNHPGQSADFRINTSPCSRDMDKTGRKVMQAGKNSRNLA